MTYVIQSRMDGTFLALPPAPGRFLAWTISTTQAHHFKTKNDAEVLAYHTWLEHWQSIVNIVPVTE